MENLFSKPLQVNMRCKDCEDRKANITVTIVLQPTTRSVHKTELLLRLTDDADPYFLFSLSISEEDFQSLKVQQGLLITFNEFPQKFIDLLNLCKQESDSDNPRFLLQLSQSPVLDSSAEFSVVETNAFKRLNHLTLRLLQGSDTDIKKHLAVCLSSMKEEKHSFEEKLKKTEDELGYALQKLSDKTRELDKLRAEWTSQEKTISNHYSQDLVSEREKALEIQTRLQKQNEDLRQEMESAHKRTTHQLQTRLAELENSNRELTERKYKNESTIRDLQIKLVGAEEEAQRAKQQVLSLRRENGTLDTECHEKERLVSQLQMRTAVLEQEVKDKDQLMCRTKELLEATQQQKDSIDGNAGKLEETVKLLSADIIKANEIIKKLMGENQKLSNKNKMKNIVTVEQEKTLLKTEEELRDVTKDLENTQQQLKHKDEQVLKLKEQLEATMQKLNESKEVLKTNENVINWLNKQLNEKLLPRKEPSPESFQTPSVLPTAGGLRAHFYPMSGKPGMSPMEAINVIPIEQHPIHIANKQSGEPVGLDSKYFERRDDSIPLHGLLPNLQNRTELHQRPSKPTSSAFFTG